MVSNDTPDGGDDFAGEVGKAVVKAAAVTVAVAVAGPIGGLIAAALFGAGGQGDAGSQG